MPSRKRSRDAHDVDGEVEVESASSSFRHAPQKRSRVAMAAANGGSVVSDDEDDDEAGDFQDRNDAYDDDGDLSLTNLSEDGEDDDEIDEIQATQYVQKTIREHRDNIASDQGVIEEVFCRNFMCHSKLRIKLGPLINFIIGHNGSGKSAVLTALTMCLGGKATATNRGASMKSLIKEGEESATLAVKIKNRGDGAYKPELYGRSITVERHFSRSGTSGFKIKNEGDKVITTKKADLDDILDFFAFQLDNPINVLTQDMARQFLSNSSPADKYKFFIRGTQLEVLDSDYKLLEEHLDNIEAKLRSREEDVSVLRDKAAEAERKKKRLDRAKNLQEKIRQTQCMHAWAQVEEQERVLERYTAEVEAAEQNVREKEQEAETDSGAHDGHNQAYEAAQRNVTQLKEQLVPIQEERDTEKEKFDVNKNKILDIKTQQRHIKDDAKKKNGDVKRLEKEIATEQDRLAGAEGGEHALRMSRLQELKKDAEDAKAAQLQHGTGYAELERQRNAAFESLEAAKPLLGQHRETLGKAEVQLAGLQRARGRPYDAYRQNMEQLVRAINNETRWRDKPVGPMGNHVRLLKPEWASVIEKTFGGALEAFVVTTAADQRLLSDLMRRVSCGVQIYIGDAAHMDASDKEPDEGVDTILRVLEIDSELVRNQLIINHRIDQTALVPLRVDAERLIQTGARNVKVAISHGARHGEGVRFDATGTGALRSSPVKKWEGPSRMKTDHEAQVRMRQEEINQIKRDVGAAENTVRQRERALELANQSIKRFQRDQKDFQIQMQKAEDAVEELNNEIESLRPQDGKLQELERQLAEVKDDLAVSQNSFQDTVNEVDVLNEKARDIKTRLDAAEQHFGQLSNRLAKAEEKQHQLDTARRNALHQKNLALELIDAAKQDLTQLEEKRDAQQQRVEEFANMATTISRRVAVEPGVTPQVLDDRIEKFSEDLRQRQREAGGTAEELTVAWTKAQAEYADAVAGMQSMTGLADLLKKTLTNRTKRWLLFRKYIAARARITFQYLLSERNFRGRVLMDHAEKVLDISVEPDLSKISDAGREARTLSGGEKSFSTICLLLSIWEAMGSPIRCLDEFDVFMDSVNRATSMTMMIQAARRSVGRQFILITPQSMNNVDMGDDVKVHKMSDPERGQTALPFTQD